MSHWVTDHFKAQVMVDPPTCFVQCYQEGRCTLLYGVLEYFRYFCSTVNKNKAKVNAGGISIREEASCFVILLVSAGDDIHGFSTLITVPDESV